MLMNDIYIAAFIFLAQELVVEPSLFPGRNLRCLCTKPVSFHISVGWISLLCTAVACDDGGEI